MKSDERLYFQSECENSVVEILNENKVIVYNIAVTDVHESFTLPESFYGRYEIRIIHGNTIFNGYIEL